MIEYLSGDIILVEGTNFMSRVVQWATVSPYSHVALVAEDCLIEALASQNAVVRSPLNKYQNVGTFHGRVVGATEGEIAFAVSWVHGWVGRHYGWREAIDSGVRDVLHVPLRPRLAHLDCSGVVAGAYRAAGHPLTRAICPTPADIWVSELVQEVM